MRGSGADEAELIMRVLRRVGNVEIFVGLVSEVPSPPARSGLLRVIE